MVYNRQSVDAETMPHIVPSAGFTPPCDYSAFAADSFDLSLLPGGETELPLSPSTQLYTQSPPPSEPVSDKPKIYTSFYPNSPEENFQSNDIELGPDFQKLLAPEDKKEIFPTAQSPNHLEVPTNNFYPDSPVSSLSYCSTPEHQLYQQNLISPQYPSSPETYTLYPNSPREIFTSSFSIVYPNSPTNITQDTTSSRFSTTSEDSFPKALSPFQIKKENYLSPCSQGNSPSSSSSYSNHSSPLNPNLNLINEVLLDNSYLDKQIKQESTVDFSELLLNNFLEDDFKKSGLSEEDDCKPKIENHQLLKQVLKDTSFQKKYNLKPFDFGLTTGFIGDSIKMEEPDADSEMMACNEELAQEKIESVLSLAIEQTRKDVANTCNALGISQDPTQWSSENVKAWLQWTVQQFKLAAVQSEIFDITGSELVALTEEEFITRAPQNGSILHAQLEIWKAACMENDLSMQWNCSSNQSSNASSGDVSEDDEEDANANPVQSTSSIKPTGTRTSGSSHIHLWQFLKELLTTPTAHGSCIRWIDRSKGVFKIEDSVRVAKLWGKRKNRPAMNYDKLSRSIRQYYKKGIMKKTERSQRLVYQFCHPYSL